MADSNDNSWGLGWEAVDVERVMRGPKLAILKDEYPRPMSEFRIACINWVDRAKTWVLPRKLSLEELNERAKLPPRGTKVHTLEQPKPADMEMDAAYSLLPKLK